MDSALFIVATPIGNIDDISHRCKRTLQEVDIIAAEDTRRAGKLLKLLNIEKKRLVSYYDEVEKERTKTLIKTMLEKGVTVALISDAGTPGISDPGYRLVAAAKQSGIPVHPIPGPSAFTALVSASGLPNHRILFIGFPPTKSHALDKEIESWRNANASIVFYESPRRLAKTLSKIQAYYPRADICIGRELTKLHEEIFSGDITTALEWSQSQIMKGEAVIMVFPNHEEKTLTLQDIHHQLVSYLKEGKHFKDITAIYKDSGISKSDLYKYLIHLKDDV